jgi:Mg2+ and Co2+ transporter CorA
MTEISVLRKQIFDLNKRRQDNINRVLNTKPFIAAQVYERYKKCGNPNCKCAKGELHGPFLWIYQKKKGQKVVSTTVAKGKHVEVKELAERYRELLRLRKQIREADQRINELLNEYESQMEKEISEYVKQKGTATAQ